MNNFLVFFNFSFKIFLGIFCILNLFKNPLFAQQLPQIFQKPITQIPDTTKQINIIDSPKKDFSPKLLPFNVYTKDSLANKYLGSESLENKTNQENTNQEKTNSSNENTKNTQKWYSSTQIGLGNYGNTLLRNKTQTPILWKNWQFFSEIFSQNAKYGAVAKEYSGNRYFLAQVGTQYIHKKIAVTASFTTQSNTNRFYNYNPEILKTFDADTLKQVFIQNSFQTQILYADTAKNWVVEGEIKFQNWQKNANQQVAEVREQVRGFSFKTVKLLQHKNNIKNRAKNLDFVGEFDFWVMPRREKELFFKRTFLQISPTLAYQLPNAPITLEGGFRVSYDNDDIKLYKRLHFYPNFSFLYHVNKDFQAKILYNGQTIKNTLANFAQQNAWIAPNINIINTQQRQNIRIRLHYSQLHKSLKSPKAQKSQTSKYQIYAEQGFAQYQNMPLWVNNPLDSAKFSLVYDQVNVTNIMAGGQYFLECNIGVFEAKAEIQHFAYQTNIQQYAWHLPEWRNNIEVRFLPKKGNKYIENMIFWLKLQGEFQRKYTNAQMKEQNLANIVDLSFGGEYLFFPKTSAFLSFFNIFDQKNPLFAGYISQGFHFLVGIAYNIK